MSYKLRIIGNITEKGDLQGLQSYRFPDELPFPPSYVSFAETYGYGRACRNLFIYIPMESHCDSLFNQSAAIKGTYGDVLADKTQLWFDLAPDMDYERLKQLFPFAKSENAYYLFWDTSVRHDGEFDIYISDFRAGFFKVAGNLYEFFDKATRRSELEYFAGEGFEPVFEALQAQK